METCKKHQDCKRQRNKCVRKEHGLCFKLYMTCVRGVEINIRVTQIYSIAQGFPLHHNTKEQS